MIEDHRHITIRPARTTDAAKLADVFACSWRHAYTGIIPHAALSHAIRNRSERWWTRSLERSRYLVLDVLDQTAGYIGFGPSRQQSDAEGEIYELYLAPLYQGLGFGEHLFEAARGTLDHDGLRGLVVWVLRDNDPARNFYENRGGRLRHRRIDLSTGAPLEKVGYHWD